MSPLRRGRSRLDAGAGERRVGKAVDLEEPEAAKPTSPPLAVGFSRPSDQPTPIATPPAEETADLARGPEPTLPVEDVGAIDPADLTHEEPTPPSREEMIQVLQDEASAKRAQQEELLRRKDEARSRVEADAQLRVENERVAFRRALHEIVSAGGAGAGQQIDDLCNQFGRNYSDAIRAQVTGYLVASRQDLARERGSLAQNAWRS